MAEYKNIPIKELVLLENNPRTVTKTEMDKLCDSLINDPTFLHVRPVLVNRIDGINYVYAGNQRVQAAKKLRWKEIFCSIEENISNDLVKERILKDNIANRVLCWASLRWSCQAKVEHSNGFRNW